MGRSRFGGRRVTALDGGSRPLVRRRTPRGTPSWSAPVVLLLVSCVLLALAPVRVAGRSSGSPPEAERGGSLVEMLGRVPDILADPSTPDGVLASYADPAAQYAAIGLDVPDSSELFASDRDRYLWMNTWNALALPSSVQTYVSSLGSETFGFGALQIEQVLAVGDVLLLRGRFDPEALESAWDRAGFKPVTVDGIVVHALPEEPADSASTAGLFAQVGMTHAAFLPDGTLLFTGMRKSVEAVLAVTAGHVAALGSRPEVAVLLGTLPATPVSALLIDGAALQSAPGSSGGGGPDETAETGAVPPARLALLGITPGGPLPGEPLPERPRSRFVIALLLDDRAEAEAAVPVIEARLRTLESAAAPGVAYRDLVRLETVSVAQDAPVLVLELEFTEERGIAVWLHMLYRRDLHYLIG